MPAMLKAEDLAPDPSVLLDLLASAKVANPAWIWAEGPEGWTLDFWKGPDEPLRWYAAGSEIKIRPGREVLHQATSGRIFAPGGELKWRVLSNSGPGCYRVVFLGADDWLPGRLRVRDELERLAMTSRVEEMILWGQRSQHSEGDWIELRIPHRFRYPVPELEGAAGARVGVKARAEIWTDRRGEPHFVRLVKLVPYVFSES